MPETNTGAEPKLYTGAPRRPRVFVACVFPEQVLDLFIRQFNADGNNTGRPLTASELISRPQGMDAVVVTATDHLDATVVSQLPSSVRIDRKGGWRERGWQSV